MRLRYVEGVDFDLTAMSQMRREQAADGTASYDQNLLHASIHRSGVAFAVEGTSALE